MKALTCLAVVGCLVGCEKASSERGRLDPGLLLSVQKRFNDVLATPTSIAHSTRT
jgi:hypothetical protein